MPVPIIFSTTLIWQGIPYKLFTFSRVWRHSKSILITARLSLLQNECSVHCDASIPLQLIHLKQCCFLEQRPQIPTPHNLPRLGSKTAHERFTMRNIVALLTASHMLYSPNAAHLWHSLARRQQAAAIMHTNNFLGSSSNLDPLLMVNGTECCRGCCSPTVKRYDVTKKYVNCITYSGDSYTVRWDPVYATMHFRVSSNR